MNLEKGFYLNDYKIGVSYWENEGVVHGDKISLIYKEECAGEYNGKKLYRRRLFDLEDIGKKIFINKEDVRGEPI